MLTSKSHNWHPDHKFQVRQILGAPPQGQQALGVRCATLAGWRLLLIASNLLGMYTQPPFGWKKKETSKKWDKLPYLGAGNLKIFYVHPRNFRKL